MSERQNIPNDLSIYYFLNQNLVFLSDLDSNPISNVEMILYLEILRKHFDIKNVEEHLKNNPGLLRLLIKSFEKDQELVTMITNSVMSHPSWFLDDDVNILQNYLTRIEQSNPPLYQRLLDLIGNSTECCVCLSNDTDTIFHCGHGTCSECQGRLERCPLCRQHIQSRTPKEELVTELKEQEEKKIIKTEEEKTKEEKKIHLQLISDKEEFIKQRISILVNSKNRLRPDNQEELTLISQEYYQDLLNQLPNIQSEEMLAFVCATLFPPITEEPWTSEQNLIVYRISSMLTNSNRLYRFLAVLNGNKPETKEKVNLKIPRRMRKLIVKIINKMNPVSALNMMNSNTIFWQLLFKAIHINEYFKKGKYKNAEIIENALRDKELSPELLEKVTKIGLQIEGKKIKLTTTEGDLDLAFGTYNKELAIKILLENRGMLFRNFRRLISKFELTKEEIDMIMKEGMEKLTTNQLLDLRHVLENHLNLQTKQGLLEKGDELLDHPVVMTSKGTLKNDYGKKDRINPDLLKYCSDNILLIMLGKMKKIEGVETLIIDEEANLQLVNKSEFSEAPSFSDRVLTRGDRIPISLDDDIIAYILWQNTADGKEVDLDLSVYGLNQYFETSDGLKCDYTQLSGFNGKMLHSGDITNAPEPSAEHVVFNIRKLRAEFPDLKYIVIVAFSYNNIPFEDMQEALVGVGINNKMGKGPENSQTLGVSKIRGASKINICATIDLEEGNIEFMNLNVKKQFVGNYQYHSVASRQKDTDKSVENFLKWRKNFAQPSHKYIANHLPLNYDKVIVVDNDRNLLFKKEKGENEIQFYNRFLAREGATDITNIQDYIDSNSSDKYLYIGSKSLKLPKNSVVLNKWKPDIEDIEWISDGYSLLDPSGLETEDKNYVDSIELILGGEGKIIRNQRHFDIKKVEANGNCLFNAILQQINISIDVTQLRVDIIESMKKKANTDPSYRDMLITNIRQDWYINYSDIMGILDDAQLLDKYFKIMSHNPVKNSQTLDEQRYPNSIFWGGYLELNELVTQLGITIGIISSTNTDILIIPEGAEENQDTIYLYYTGNHYNIARLQKAEKEEKDKNYKYLYYKYKNKYIQLKKNKKLIL